MTVLEVIQKSTPYLTKHGVDSPRLQVELLLAHVLKLPRLQLYLNFERVLTEAEVGELRSLVQKRGTRVPLQHLVGTAAFHGLDFKVTGATLIPRPETELLVEHALKVLGAAPGGSEPIEILDLGTGTGCIAITLAVKHPGVRVTAVDASPAALEIAQANARAHGVEERVQFVAGPWFEPLTTGRQFDLVVSNPPYIPSEEIGALMPEVRDHDPKLALDGGPDGLSAYRIFATEGRRWCKPGGAWVLEVGDGQADSVAELFRVQNWIVEAIHPDYSARPRLVVIRAGSALHP